MRIEKPRGVNIKEEWEKHKKSSKKKKNTSDNKNPKIRFLKELDGYKKGEENEDFEIIDGKKPTSNSGQNSDDISILDFFDEAGLEEKSDGTYRAECPSHKSDSGNPPPFIIFPDNNGWFCQSSKKHGGMLELYAMQQGLIACKDCLGSGEKGYVLEGDILTEVLDLLLEKLPKQKYESLLKTLGFRKSIKLPNDGKLISEFAAQIAKEIKDKYRLFYRSETQQVVEVSKIKHPSGEYEFKGFMPINCKRFITHVERYFKPWKYVYMKNGKKKSVVRSMTQNTAGVALESDDFIKRIPVVSRIFTIQQPIIYNNQLTFPKKGYDERFGSWLSQDTPYISNPQMSLDEAKKIIKYIFKEFCFQTKQDETNAVAALLTPFLRGLYPNFNTRAPIFIYEANRERAGKDYCAGITGILYEGGPIEDPPISTGVESRNSNEELRKKILGNFIAGRKRMHFSNNKGNLDNAILESLITNPNFTDRMLGGNKIVSFPNEVDLSASGNLGITMTGDLINRSIFIKLFLDIEDPNQRRFKNPNLHKWVRENRDKILSALYALVRNWVEKGCIAGSKPFASFPEWAEICGGIMESAEFSNPCVKNEDMGVAINPEESDMKALFELCLKEFHEEFVKRKQIVDFISNKDEDIFSNFDFFQRSDQTRFGKIFSKYVGRILSDIKLICDDRNKRSSRRKYKFVKQKSEYESEGGKNNKSKCENGQNTKSGGENKQKVVTLATCGNVSLPSPHLLYSRARVYRKSLDYGRTLPNVTNVTTPPHKSQDKNKSDRKTQFYEAPETQQIKPNHTKKDILEYIKNNPGVTSKKIYDKFGVGSLKFKSELIEEGKIKQQGEKLKCVKN